MNIKQLKEIISKFPDETEIFVIDGDLEIYKPNDDLFLIKSDSLNGLSLMVEHYNDESQNLSKLKNGTLDAINPLTGEEYPETSDTVTCKLKDGEWKVCSVKNV